MSSGYWIRFWTLVPRMQAATSDVVLQRGADASWLRGSGGPITIAPVTHAWRCRPSRPPHRFSTSAADSVRVPAAVSTNARYQHGRTNSAGWAPHSARGSVTGSRAWSVSSMPFTANQ